MPLQPERDEQFQISLLGMYLCLYVILWQLKLSAGQLYVPMDYNFCQHNLSILNKDASSVLQNGFSVQVLAPLYKVTDLQV